MVFAEVFAKAQKRKRNDDLPEHGTTKEKYPKKLRGEEPNHKSHIQKSGVDPKLSIVKTKSRDGIIPQAQKKPKKRKKLSQGALRLSSKLQELSQKKLLSQALEIYWDSQNEKIRDGFHACIAVDCCARCGDMEEAEKIIKEVKRSGRVVNVETKTALIKGYSHSGDMARSSEIFESMCKEKAFEHQPNVRTLNTFLRGCMWTAATLNNKDQIVGGVVSSERAWKLFRQLQEHPPGGFSASVDISSFEYSISLLSYALRINDTEERIRELREMYGVTSRKGELEGGNRTILETLATAYLGLARANAVLGHKKEALDACRLASASIIKAKGMPPSCPTQEINKNDGSTALGEKRAWKTTQDERRASSNVIYRDHRLSELEINVRSIVQICKSESFFSSPEALAKRLVTGLLYFSGGGTTQKDFEASKSASGSQVEARLLRRHLINSSWLSFGLAAALKRGGSESNLAPSTDFIRVKLSERIFREIGEGTGAVQNDGFIDFSCIFPGERKPLDVELGAGHGDWIVHQAAQNNDRNHVAVELRADRVAQIFAKGILRDSKPLDNLCVVGDECKSFLTQRLKPGSASNIFVNHPEPPTQVFGENDSDLEAVMEGGPEPAHVLSSNAVVAVARCLSHEGKIVIVTDNKCYARLLCVTVVKVNRLANKLRVDKLRSVKLDPKASMLKEVETFPASLLLQGSLEECVVLLEGQPCRVIGHATESEPDGYKGSTYFDRLWRTGASQHASKKERYIIVLERA